MGNVPAQAELTPGGTDERKITCGKSWTIKAGLTLLLILGALWLGFSGELYPDAFRAAAVASFVLVHLRIRPKWVDVLSVVLITAFFGTVNSYAFHRLSLIISWVAFSGLSSLLIVAVRSVWERDRRILLYALIPSAIFVTADHFDFILHNWTARAHPNTLDLFLLSFDGSLRIQPAFWVGQWFARLAWLRDSALIAYVGIAIPIALIYACRLARFREGAFPSMIAFLIAGPIGFLCYNIFPACGPRFVFGPAFPFRPISITLLSQVALAPAAIQGWRNAMPSLHLTWALLAWWYSKGLFWLPRAVASVFLILILVATLGIGEHWFIDLIVAFPYALIIKAICSCRIPWKDPARKAAVLWGLAGTLGWMGVLRYGTELFWTSPIVPWAFCVATVALVLLRETELEVGGSESSRGWRGHRRLCLWSARIT